ncbi:Uncharacterised protein [Vibrio cholerae]|nr:Uncharacterised protein [Vibrio cholerae]
MALLHIGHLQKEALKVGVVNPSAVSGDIGVKPKAP